MLNKLQRLADFVLFTSLYIALLAVAMAYSTFILFGYTSNFELLGFIFGGTLCSYNFHWLLTPALAGGNNKAAWSYRNRNVHAVLFACGLAISCYFSIQLIAHWHWLLLTAFVTFLYSAPKIPLKPFKALKKIAVGKTAFLALAWTHIPFMLPLLLSTNEWTVPEYLFIANRFYLIYSICILFDYRDRENDRQQGIKSMITQFNNPGINALFWGSMTAFMISGALLYTHGHTVLQTVFTLIPGLILAANYHRSKSKTSDYFFYFFLDGLMALTSLLLLLLQ